MCTVVIKKKGVARMDWKCKLRMVQDAKVRPRVDVSLHLGYISCVVFSSYLSSE